MIARLWRDKAAKGFMQLLGGNALTSVAQGIQFFILARSLGPSEFGKVAAANGVWQLLMPFAGLGSPNVMIMRAAREPAVLPLYLGNAFLNVLVTGILIVTFATFAITPALNGQVPILVMGITGIAELCGTRVVDVCWQVFMAREELRVTSMFLSAQSVARLFTAAAFATFVERPTAEQWIWWVLAGSMFVGAWTGVTTLRKVGRLRIDVRLLFRELGVGVAFALGQSARGFYTDADKMFLARYTSATVVGQYTMAFRVVQIALTVIRALAMALQTRLYRAGHAGIFEALQLTKRVLKPTVIGALLLAVAFYVAAPLLTVIAGERYLPSVEMLRFMCLMPLATAVSVLLLEALWTSTGYQRAAAISQIITAVLVCALSIALIPRLGWSGAALASYIAQAALCGLTLFSMYRGRGVDPTLRNTSAS